MAQLPYPDRFHAAAEFAGFSSSSSPSSPSSTSSRSLSTQRLSEVLPDETRLILFALYKQATLGPCTVKKPWGWNVVEHVKWTSWNHLGNMNSLEAMRLFVRTVEGIDPNWYAKERTLNLRALEDSAAVESASKELTKLLLEKNVPTLSKASDSVVSKEKHVQDEVMPLLEENNELNESEIPKLPEMDEPVAEGIDAITSYREWVPVNVTGRKPLARYQHSAAVVEGKLYVIGGNHNGRYLNDVQVLDLKTLTWSKVDTRVPQSPFSSKQDPLQPWLPQCAGHRLIRWKELLLVVGGHAKPAAETVTVHSFDIHSLSWTKLSVYGQAPVSRGGHSVTLIGTQLYMFGGEDLKRRLFNDLNILDLETMTWKSVIASGACPSPRADHVATAYRDSCIFVFGGGSHSDCYNDLHALDLETMEWALVPTKGIVPRPRAGHAGATHGDNWYVVGGGDNTGAISETLVLNMATLSWSVEDVVQVTSATASEGLSVEVAENALLAFGGYNGYFSNEVHAYILGPALLPEIVNQVPPVEATEQNTTSLNEEGSSSDSEEIIESSALDEESDAKVVSKEDSPSTSRREAPPNDEIEQRFRNDELEQLRMAVGAAQAEVEKLKVENAAALSSLADVEQELLLVRSQLQGEQSRSFRLEVEIAELRQKLLSMEALQKELDLLHRQMAVSERAANEASQKDSKVGVWGWLAGAPPASRYD